MREAAQRSNKVTFAVTYLLNLMVFWMG